MHLKTSLAPSVSGGQTGDDVRSQAITRESSVAEAPFELSEYGGTATLSIS